MGLGYVIGILGGVLIAGILLKIGEWAIYRRLGSAKGYMLYLLLIVGFCLGIVYIL